MGHADIQTTIKYLHYAPREDDAAPTAHAFAPAGREEVGSQAEPDKRGGVLADEHVRDRDARVMESELQELSGQRPGGVCSRSLCL
jgi:hypothetical protein